MSQKARRIKCLLVGDKNIGKSVLARRCGRETEPGIWDSVGKSDVQRTDEVVPKVSPFALHSSPSVKRNENSLVTVEMLVHTLHPNLEEDMLGLAEVAYHYTDVVGLCYKVTEKETLENAVYKVGCLPGIISH